MKILFKTRYGSTLYGTSIPSSDEDIRAVYLPPIQDCILQKVSRAFEGKESEDHTTFSLQYFGKLLNEGQNIAIEMICAPDSMVLETSDIFEYIRKSRKYFFSKNMHSFCSFARNMVSKYSVRVDRLNETEEALKVITSYLDSISILKLGQIWDLLPTGQYLEKKINDRNTNTDNRIYMVCGRQIQATVPIRIAYEVISGLKANYGERVLKAQSNDFDYKAINHSFRVLYQVKEIVETKDLVFPLQNANWLRDVRLGKYHFINDGLQEKLDSLLSETEKLVAESDLPDKPNQDLLNNIILNAYGY